MLPIARGSQVQSATISAVSHIDDYNSHKGMHHSSNGNHAVGGGGGDDDDDDFNMHADLLDLQRPTIHAASVLYESLRHDALPRRRDDRIAEDDSHRPWKKPRLVNNNKTTNSRIVNAENTATARAA
jgi:hypothetical protein